MAGERGLSNGTDGKENDHAFHGFGNNLVRTLIKWIYGFKFFDVMTGYRAFNAVFVKTMPALSPGFEIETKFSIMRRISAGALPKLVACRKWRIETQRSFERHEDPALDPVAVQRLSLAGTLDELRVIRAHDVWETRQ